MNKSRAIIVFVKYPEEGKVKTRLASTTSNSFATGIYKIISKNIFDELAKLNNEIDVHIFYAPFDDLVKIKNWVGKKFVFKVQRGSDLGDRIANAFENIFLRNYKRAMIIGSDIPNIDCLIINESFNSLESYDVVISPSDDGGYSLLGMNRENKFLFENIEWSTDSVFKTTKNKIIKNQLSLKTLNQLNDIDTFDDLVNFVNKSENTSMKREIKNLGERENIFI